MACKCNPECIKCMDGICLNCRAPCKPVCGICKGLDSACDVGPECNFKTVGCELTCGVPAIEAQLGVWHIATDMFPSKLPAILYPCVFGPVCCRPLHPIISAGLCMFFVPVCCPVCCPGKDEEMKGDSFSIGGPTVGENIKIMRFFCGRCSPYDMIKKSIWGLVLDPPFDGDIPAWYNAGPTTATDKPPKNPEGMVSASNFGSSDNCVCSHGSLVPMECKSSTRVPLQLVMSQM